MNRRHDGVWLFVCGIAALLAGCTGPVARSDGTGEPAPSGAATGATGSVGASLALGPGIALTAVPWTISNGQHTYTGVAAIGDAQSVEWVAGGVAAGAGYTISVRASDSNGDVCTGTSSPFSVSAGAVSDVTLTIVCAAPSDAAVTADVTTGSVAIDASVSRTAPASAQCPGISSMSVNPAEIVVGGQTAALEVTTVGPPASIAWSVSAGPAGGGLIAAPTAASTTFSCTVPGLYAITAKVGLPGSDVCDGVAFTTLTANVTCEPAGTPGPVAKVSAPGATTTFVNGPLPAPKGPLSTTAPLSRNVTSSGSTEIDLSSSTPITTAFIGVEDAAGNVIGYWRTTLGSPATLAPLLLGWSASLPSGFSLVFAVGDAAGDVSAPASTAFVVSAAVPPSPASNFAECVALGDPHLLTFDGLRYDCQPVGELTLVRSTSDNLEIQIRTKPWGARTDVSIVDAVAARVAADRVAFYKDGTATLNGASTSFPAGPTALPGGGTVYAVNNGFVVVWPDQSQLRLDFGGDFIGVRVFVPPARASAVAGLCGNFDHSVSNDWTTRDGTTTLSTTTAPTYAQFYGTYVNGWRVKTDDSDSLFDYPTGQTTANFTDLNFPHLIASTQSLSAAETAAANTVCQAAAVPTAWSDPCVLDVAVTGDPSFSVDMSGAPPVSAVGPLSLPPPPLTGQIIQGGGLAVAGVGFAGRGGSPVTSATIHLTGIPAGAVILAATLYYDTIGGAQATITMDGVHLTADFIGHAGDTCWGEAPGNFAYRADVTPLVTGSGAHVLTGFPSVAGFSSGADGQGASILVLFQDPSDTRMNFVDRAEIIQTVTNGGTISNTFSALQVPASFAAATAINIVGDGQTFADELLFNSTSTGSTNAFAGADGNFWDSLQSNVAPELAAGQTSFTTTIDATDDCLVWIVNALVIDNYR